jgi:hypothetical protein
MDTGPTNRPFASLQALRSGLSVSVEADTAGADLLELHTTSGTVYVRPSRWQRVRLGWAFRHFHVIPAQVLSSSNRRLIDRLIDSAAFTTGRPVARDRVFGVVENVRLEQALVQAPVQTPLPVTQVARQAVERKPVPVTVTARPGRRWEPEPSTSKTGFSSPILPSAFAFKQRRRFTADVRSSQWGALGVLAAVCAFVVLVRFVAPSLFPSAASKPASTSASAIATALSPGAPGQPAGPHLGKGALPPLTPVASSAFVPYERIRSRMTLPEAAPLMVAEKPALRRAAPQPLNASTERARPANELEMAAAPVIPATPELRFVSELPQGHFAEPVVTDPGLVGELRLRAVIGSDGSVKEVSVVSGNPKLAEVGMRAVRRWRYQALDHPGEAETLIRMRFFGQDGVSIASMGKENQAN